MGRELVEIEHVDGAAVDHRGVGVLGQVAARQRQPLEQALLQRFLARLRRRDRVRQLGRACGVADDLHRLDARDLVEEPAAAGVHQQRVALQLEQLEHARALGRVQGPERVALQQPLDRVVAAIEDRVDVGVARGPRVAQQRRGAALVDLGQPRGEPVERLLQRPAPALRPARVTAAVAAAVAAPALDAVGAAPRAALDHAGLVLGRMLREELTVVGQPDLGRLLERVQRVGQRHVAVAMVVAVGLAVGRDVDQLRPVAAVEGAAQPRGEAVAALQQPLERDRLRHRAVVEEHRDLSPAAELDAVGPLGIDARAVDVVPRCLGVAQGPRGRGLVRRQHGEAHALVGEQLERLEIDRGLGQPDALGAPAEAGLEVAQAPADLRAFVATRRQRQDRVVVGLRHGRAVAAEALAAQVVGRNDRAVDVATVALEPRQQRGPEVEAHARVVADDARDVALLVEDARRGVGAVALRGDALVPVVERIRRLLHLDGLEPRVLAWRLIEVTVDADVALAHGSPQRSMMVESGGSVSVTDHGRPWAPWGSASTRP
ncbi:MAG: hypothetical protein U0168_22860 [Nannocystaceae bacterium]